MYPTTFMPPQGKAPHTGSWYAASAGAIPDHPALKGYVRADVAIIGAGYTGLSAARSLARSGLKVVVLEANKVGWGASGRNGGQIHPGQRMGADWMARTMGREAARDLLALAEQARLFQRALIAEHGIDCDLRQGLIHGIHKKRWVESERRHVDHLAETWGIVHRFLERDEIAARIGSGVYHAGTYDPDGGQLHPLKFALGLARAAVECGAVIHENSRVLSLVHGDKPILRCEAGEVQADHVILAGNGYLGGLDPETDAHILPLNNFILATEPLAQRLIPGEEAVSDSRFVVYYWHQTPDLRLVFGGGETFTPRFPRDMVAFVRRHLRNVYPDLVNAPVSHAWGGTLGITFNRMPYVRRPRANVWISAGYSGQGVMMAPFAGHILAEAVAGTMSRFDKFAAIPTPAFPGGTLLRWPTQVAAMSWFKLLDMI